MKVKSILFIMLSSLFLMTAQQCKTTKHGNKSSQSAAKRYNHSKKDCGCH